ncbi:TolC family protein [Granulicella cerasi]|uniref:TolC family protein n=1 Tax=Granulicella cerasi TaxID=741063 RepID=A0ABW1ZAR2_9BACT|nr:TolC family protein [Granulicella cerasi]
MAATALGHAHAQCAAIASTDKAASTCAANHIPSDKIASLDAAHAYTLAELIDIGELNNPSARIAWEAARQRAKALGIEKAEYFPQLAAVALFADQRAISPFPKPLAPRGYTVVEVPVVEPSVSLQYLLVDFGGRHGRVDAARAAALSAGAHFIQANQQVAAIVATGFYAVMTADERLASAQETLKTAQTTEAAARARLDNGRATLPDLLNASAERAQAAFDLEAADGAAKIARVTLSEAIGVEPSPELKTDTNMQAALPSALALSIDELIQRSLADRPDLIAQMDEVKRADAELRVAKSAYRPEISLAAKGAQTSVWPTVDYGMLGHASVPTWSAAVQARWTIFDGGVRKNRVAAAESAKRLSLDELRERKDRIRREVWNSYIGFRTALRQEEAAVALLKAANMSYSASLDAYQNGVKNLVDVVTAEKQLAQARLSSVAARSRLFTEAVDLEKVTGNLLRTLPSATTTSEERE